jgi:hypothetical protein
MHVRSGVFVRNELNSPDFRISTPWPLPILGSNLPQTSIPPREIVGLEGS